MRDIAAACAPDANDGVAVADVLVQQIEQAFDAGFLAKTVLPSNF